MIEKIKEFLEVKKCTGYKINDEPIVCDFYPEAYSFIRKEEDIWVYGITQRNTDKILQDFKTEEEALMKLVFELYTYKISSVIKKSYGIKWYTLTNDEIIKQTNKNFDTRILENLQVLNEEQLIYKEKYIINNSFFKRTIEDFRVYKIFLLKAFEQTRNELIEFGVDAVELDKYFRFENLVEL